MFISSCLVNIHLTDQVGLVRVFGRLDGFLLLLYLLVARVWRVAGYLRSLKESTWLMYGLEGTW